MQKVGRFSRHSKQHEKDFHCQRKQDKCPTKQSKNGSHVSRKIDVTAAPKKYVQLFCNICSQNVTFQQEWALPACVKN